MRRRDRKPIAIPTAADDGLDLLPALMEADRAAMRAERLAKRALRGEEPPRPDQARMRGSERPRSRFEIN